MNLEYHPLTVLDLNEAANYYDEIRSGLGYKFRIAVYETIARIKETPYTFAETEGVRRALVKRFPYSVIYRIAADDTIRVLIIRHHKRHPKYGTSHR